MKTYSIVLVCLSLLLFACPSSDDDSSNNDFLTANNYVSENNLFSFHLESEIALIQVEIDSLQAIIDDMQGDATTQMNLDNATSEQSLLNSTLANLVLKGNPIPLPPPPPPCPTINTCFPVDALYFVTLSTNLSMIINVYDDQNNLIGSTANTALLQLPGYNSDFKYQAITMTPYSGDVTVVVQKLDAQNNMIEFEVAGYTQ